MLNNPKKYALSISSRLIIHIILYLCGKENEIKRSAYDKKYTQNIARCHILLRNA